jgi:SAM-dependent methyltransferase
VILAVEVDLMNPEDMEPLGLALADYFGGNASATLIIRREDGLETTLPASHFFRAPDEFSAIENAALDRCRGRVLDVGAGSGLHSLALQDRGFSVTAIDISRHAVEIMTRRRVREAHCADVFRFDGGPFDTLLMMGHGIGMVETLAGLDRFLQHAGSLLAEDGQVLLDSHDVRKTDDPVHLAYHEARRQAGRYIGEIRVQLECQGKVGPTCGWLHVDAETLAKHAGQAGWEFEVILQEPSGDYLAGLAPQRAA